MKQEEVFQKALKGKKIPVLTLDNKWHRLFTQAECSPDIKLLSEELNELLKRQGKITTETKKIKNVSLKLLMNDLTTPVHEVGLIGVSPATGYEPLNLALTQAEEWDNLLKIVLFQGKEERSNPKPQEQSV